MNHRYQVLTIGLISKYCVASNETLTRVISHPKHKMSAVDNYDKLVSVTQSVLVLMQSPSFFGRGSSVGIGLALRIQEQSCGW